MPSCGCPRVSAGSRTAVLLAPALLLLFVRPFVTTADPDYWWYVETGRLIVTTGAMTT